MSFKQLDQCLRLSVALLVLPWSVTESVIRSIEGELRPQKKNLTSGQSSTYGPVLSRNWIRQAVSVRGRCTRNCESGTPRA